jgi:hypothetical protein
MTLTRHACLINKELIRKRVGDTYWQSRQSERINLYPQRPNLSYDQVSVVQSNSFAFPIRILPRNFHKPACHNYISFVTQKNHLYNVILFVLSHIGHTSYNSYCPIRKDGV